MESDGIGDVDGSTGSGYGVPVWISGGKTQLLIELVNHEIRHSVLEVFCFFVDLVPAITQYLDQKSLNEAMPADHG